MALRKTGKTKTPSMQGESCAACGPTLCGCHVAGLFCTCGMWVKAVVAIAVVMAFSYLWHGNVMMADYANSSVLWRPYGQMDITLIYIANALLGLVYAIVFSLSYRGTGVVEGLKNGVLIASPMAISSLYAYATQPIPANIIQLWVAGDLIQGALVGLVLSLACRCGCR